MAKTDLSRFRHAKPGARIDLASFDPAAKPYSRGSKDRDRAAVEELAIELDTLQNLLLADGRAKMLVVLQGLDTSGKDGTLRTVFGRMSPLGVRSVAWKAPTGRAFSSKTRRSCSGTHGTPTRS